MQQTVEQKMAKRKHLFIGGGCVVIALIILSFVLFAHSYRRKTDYAHIQHLSTLRVIVEPNSMSYQVVDIDSIAGLQALMIKQFAADHQIDRVVFINEPNLSAAIDSLLQNKVDILAWHIPIYNQMRQKINYTIPVFTSRQMLIQRKENKADSIAFIRNQLELANQNVYILPGAFYRQRLNNLSKEIGDSIYIREIPNAVPSDLLNMLLDHHIDYAVLDEFVARVLLKKAPYRQLDMSTAISFTQNYSWALNPNTPVLCDSINAWLEVYLESKEYNKIYRQYTGVP
jgi:ABC-type amino acid transport substrate-binding protein